MYEIKPPLKTADAKYRLLQDGPRNLSDVDLLALVLKTGNKHLSAMQLAQAIMNSLSSLAELRRCTVTQLTKLPGIGEAKAIQIQALCELGRRMQLATLIDTKTVLDSHDFGYYLINQMRDYQQEHLLAVYLNPHNHIIREQVIFVGTVNQSVANPREILHYAVKYLATKLIIAHNHPSGIPEPSKEDKRLTKGLSQACQLIGLELLDHFVIGLDRYYSFAESGLL